MNTLDEIIEAGKKKLEAEEKAVSELNERAKLYNEKSAETLVRMALDLIPEQLRPYASVDDCQWLVIDVPGCANISCPLSVQKSSSRYADEINQWVSDFESVTLDTRAPDGGWVVATWEAYHGDDGWMPILRRTYYRTGLDDVEVALGKAAIIGNNRDAVEREVASKKSADKEKTSAAPVVKRKECPFNEGACVREMCALWVEYNNLDACSFKVMAWNASNGICTE
jgi:hypothetical protein